MKSPKQNAWISGMGLVSPAGIGVAPLWNAVLEERPLTQEGLGRIPHTILQDLQNQFPEARASSSPSLLAFAAAKMAMKQAGWDRLNSEADGLIIGTTTGEIPLWEDHLIDYRLGRISAADCAEGLAHQPLGAIAKTLSDLFEFRGRSLVLSSACSASTQALAVGALWIQLGWVKRCLVGGTEILSRLTVEGFRSLQLLSSSPATPFDAQRQGINLSEGSAFLCLEAQPGSTPLAGIAGFGLSSDAYHATAPQPEGRGILQAMTSALQNAGVPPEEIDWVHVHGTGSRANDAAEGSAITRLFGPDSGPWVSSTKGCHGHALGASGAIESALSVLAIQEGIVPRTVGLREPDPEIRVRHPRTATPCPIRNVLKTTLGFGGNNAALVFSAPKGSTR